MSDSLEDLALGLQELRKPVPEPSYTLRQEDCKLADSLRYTEFQVSLGHIARLCLRKPNPTTHTKKTE